MSNAQIKAIEDYIRLLDRNAITHAIRTAADLGVFDALAKRQHTLDELCEELNLNADALDLLMDVLCETELVQKFRDDFALSTVGKLIPPAFRDFGDHHWQYLRSYIRTGMPLPVHEDIPVTEADFRGDRATTEWIQTPAALDTANILGAGSERTGLRILEIGCGAAVFGAALAHRDEDCQLVLLDDQSGIKRASKSISGVGVEGRTQYVEADYRDETIQTIVENECGNSGFDLLIMTEILHRHTLDECGDLIKRIGGLLKQDGEMAIVDIFPGQEKGSGHRAVMALELGLRTRHGKVHNPEELTGILKKAGFEKIQYSHLPSPPFVLGLIVAGRE
ncbi:MAG: class I SAM-dependent methyltransferase [Planctomycetota bacterium]